MALVFEIPDLTAAIEDRLKAMVLGLKTVEGVTSLSDVIDRKILPSHTPAAWVLDLGATGERPDFTTGEFSQPITTTVGIVIAARANDRLANQAGGKLKPLSMEVMAALSGWSPDIDQTERMQFSRDRLIEVNKGAIWRQVDFTVEWTLHGTEPERADLDDFNTGVPEWYLAAPDGTTDAKDTITLEQDQ